MPRPLCSPKIENARNAADWLRRATRDIGLGFHPDTPASEYINVATEKPLFVGADAEAFDAARMRAFEMLGERVYDQGLRIQQRHLRGVQT